MSAEDRDRLFEKALARHLRAEGGADESVCPDAETLAAYHERMLAPDETMSAKSHIVACARCQEILAQLEMTQGTQESLEREADTVAVAASPAAVSGAQMSSRKVAPFPATKRNLLRWVAPAGAIAAGILIFLGVRNYHVAQMQSYSNTQVAQNRDEAAPVPEAGPATPGNRAREQRSDAPGGNVRQEDSLRSSKASRDQEPALSAQNKLQEQANANLASPMLAAPQAVEKKAARKPSAGAASAAPQFQAGAGSGGGFAPKKEDLAAGGKIAAYDDALADRRLQKSEDSQAAVAGGLPKAPVMAPPPPPAPVSSAAKALPAQASGTGQLHGMVTDSSGAAVAGASVALKSEKGSTVASTSTDNAGAYTFNEVAAGNYQLELQSAGFKTDNITGLNVAPGDNVIDAKLQVGASTQTVEVSGQAAEVSSEVVALDARQKDKKQLALNGRNLTALNALQSVASAPDGRNIWRFGAHGEIAHSGNGGKNWETQVAPVAGTLSSGSAPSNRVCWIAGAAGTLIRTTDRGKHWQIVTTPLTGDLGGVKAADEKHATIWDSGNRMRYETSDGGVTWQPTANQ